MLSLGANTLVGAIDSSCSSSDDSSESELESSKLTVVSGTLAYKVEEPLKDKYGESFLKSCLKFSSGMKRRQDLISSYFKRSLARYMDELVTKLTALISKRRKKGNSRKSFQPFQCHSRDIW